MRGAGEGMVWERLFLGFKFCLAEDTAGVESHAAGLSALPVRSECIGAG